MSAPRKARWGRLEKTAEIKDVECFDGVGERVARLVLLLGGSYYWEVIARAPNGLRPYNVTGSAPDLEQAQREAEAVLVARGYEVTR